MQRMANMRMQQMGQVSSLLFLPVHVLCNCWSFQSSDLNSLPFTLV
jgi:hypothetical protein